MHGVRSVTSTSARVNWEGRCPMNSPRRPEDTDITATHHDAKQEVPLQRVRGHFLNKTDDQALAEVDEIVGQFSVTLTGCTHEDTTA